jgi:hypothetical protein
MRDLGALTSLLRLAAKDRHQLVLESIALRHQRPVYKRSLGRPNGNDMGRIFWLTLMGVPKQWLDARVIVLSRPQNVRGMVESCVPGFFDHAAASSSLAVSWLIPSLN